MPLSVARPALFADHAERTEDGRVSILSIRRRTVRCIHQSALKDLANLRPHGMVDDETLLQFDREVSAEGRRTRAGRLWVASTHAVYLIDPPRLRTNYGFRLRICYDDIATYRDDRQPDGLLRRELTATIGNENIHLEGTFKRPWIDLDEIIRGHVESGATGAL